MIKEALKQRYDGKKIGEIEGEIKTNHNLSIEGQREMTFALTYLRITGRYKENPLYRESSFAAYLIGQYNMREATFMERERAFLHFYDETKRYGVGLVAKVHRLCGAKKEAVVFKAIKKAEDALQTPIKQEKIESIIIAHAPPPKEKPIRVDWEEKYNREYAAHQETKHQLLEAKDQIEKLKKTVLELTPLRLMKAAIMPFLLEKRA